MEFLIGSLSKQYSTLMRRRSRSNAEMHTQTPAILPLESMPPHIECAAYRFPFHLKGLQTRKGDKLQRQRAIIENKKHDLARVQPREGG